jgi:hypothetical protein
MFRSENHRYLGIDGPARDGAQIVSVDEPVGFDIQPDPHVPNAFKCAPSPLSAPCPAALALTNPRRVFAPGTDYCFDLSDNGNRDDGTIVTLWYKWEGKHQSWIFDQV